MARVSLKWVVWVAIGYATLLSASPAGAQYGKNDQQHYQDEQRRRDEENRRQQMADQQHRADEQRRHDDQVRRQDEEKRRNQMEEQRRQGLQRDAQKASPASTGTPGVTVTQRRDGKVEYKIASGSQPTSYSSAQSPKADRTSAASANTKAARANTQGPGGGPLPPGSLATHHPIPNEQATHPMTVAARRAGYNIDNPNNFKVMPTRPDLPKYTENIIHDGSHPKYSAEVKSQMDLRWYNLQYSTRQEAIANGWSPAKYDYVLGQRARDEMKRLENEQRSKIDNGNVPTKPSKKGGNKLG